MYIVENVITDNAIFARFIKSFYFLDLKQIFLRLHNASAVIVRTGFPDAFYTLNLKVDPIIPKYGK